MNRVILSLFLFPFFAHSAEEKSPVVPFAEEESGPADSVRKKMKSHGWDPTNVTVVGIGESGRTSIIRRNGTIVGYHYVENRWEPADVDAGKLGDVTRITYGYAPDSALGIPNLFEITDPIEIALWTTAYKEHTEMERQFSHFVPISEAAGFPRKREEIQDSAICACSLGLRFYRADKELLQLKGHLDISSGIDPRYRNKVLHELSKAKMPKEKPAFDPFGEDASKERKPAKPDAGGKRE